MNHTNRSLPVHRAAAELDTYRSAMLRATPDLSAAGWRCGSNDGAAFDAGRTLLASDEGLRQFAGAEAFLQRRARFTRAVRPAAASDSLARLASDATGVTVSEGALILAALDLCYPHRRCTGSPTCTFGIELDATQREPDQGDRIDVQLDRMPLAAWPSRGTGVGQ